MNLEFGCPYFFLIENQCSFWLSTSSIRNQKSLLWCVWSYFILYSLSSFFPFFPPFSLFIGFVFLFPFIQLSRSIMSNSLRPYRLQHTQASLSITNSQSLLKLISIELMMQSSHFIVCRPLLLQPSIFPSIRVFSSETVLCIKWPKYWSFSFSISLSNEYSGLISFEIDWLDLLADQGTLKSLLQHRSKASILWCQAFFVTY